MLRLTSQRRALLVFAIPAFTIFCIFQNHYTRDTVGAMEKQMESDLGITPLQYSTLNSIYFIPNIFAPLFTGLLCDLCGRPSIFLLLCVGCSCCGQLLFTIGANCRSLPLFYFGRFLSGAVYEITDTVPIIMMGPMFKHSWGFIVGVMNCFLRLGSVFTFLFSPHMYSAFGVMSTLWLSTAVAVLGVAAAVGAYVSDVKFELLQQQQQQQQQLLSQQERSSSGNLIHQCDGDGHLISEREYLNGNSSNNNNNNNSYSSNINSNGYGSNNISNGSSSSYQPHQQQQQQQQQQRLYQYSSIPNSDLESATTTATATTMVPRLKDDSAAEFVSLTRSHSLRHPSTLPAAHSHNNNNNNNNNSNSSNSISSNSSYGISPMNSADSTAHGSDTVKQQQQQQYSGINSSNNNNNNNNSSNINYCCQCVLRAAAAVYRELPFRYYGAQYYCYLLNGMFLFGAMVPFWFIGAKFFQVNYNLDVHYADALMLVPEGAMVLISPLLGLAIDRYNCSLPFKLVFLSCACAGMTASYLLLAYGYHHQYVNDTTDAAVVVSDAIADAGAADSITRAATTTATLFNGDFYHPQQQQQQPWLQHSLHMLLQSYTKQFDSSSSTDSSTGTSTSTITIEDDYLSNLLSIVDIHPLLPMTLLGISYACANSLTWDCIVYIVPDAELLAPASGLYASALNILPSALPHLIVYLSDNYDSNYNGDDDRVDAAITAQSNMGMQVLAATALVAAVFAFAASFYGTPEAALSAHELQQQQQQKQQLSGAESKAATATTAATATGTEVFNGGVYEMVSKFEGRTPSE